MKRLFLPALFCLPLFTSAAAVPAAPGTDIWLADLDVTADAIAASNPRNLTNRPGYDNQPAFVTTHSFLFASMDANGQTDAWRYELADVSAAPVLETPESEYSPTPAPGGALSVVHVSPDGLQQLRLLAPGGSQYELLFPLLEGIGYHAWVDSERVALFMVREPSELHIANRETGKVIVLAKGIGRCLQSLQGADPGIAFIEAGQDGKRWIKRLDLVDRRITPLAPVLENSEDFVFLPGGRPVMAHGKALFVWRDDAWHEFARFDTLPGDITRLAVSPDARRLLMVVAERS